MSAACDSDVQMIDSSSIQVHQHAANSKNPASMPLERCALTWVTSMATRRDGVHRSLLPGTASDQAGPAATIGCSSTGGPSVLRLGAHLRDRPERYDKWKRLHNRCIRWAKAGG